MSRATLPEGRLIFRALAQPIDHEAEAAERAKYVGTAPGEHPSAAYREAVARGDLLGDILGAGGHLVLGAEDIDTMAVSLPPGCEALRERVIAWVAGLGLQVQVVDEEAR